MDDFRIIYRILRNINIMAKAEEPDMRLLSAQALKTTEENRDRLILNLIDDGYVKGFHVLDNVDGLLKPVILWDRSQPSITTAGMQYLQENSMMKKAMEMAKRAADIFH